MESTIVYWGFIGIMEKKMEATIVMSFERSYPCRQVLDDDVVFSSGHGIASDASVTTDASDRVNGTVS